MHDQLSDCIALWLEACMLQTELCAGRTCAHTWEAFYDPVYINITWQQFYEALVPGYC